MQYGMASSASPRRTGLYGGMPTTGLPKLTLEENVNAPIEMPLEAPLEETVDAPIGKFSRVKRFAGMDETNWPYSLEQNVNAPIELPIEEQFPLEQNVNAPIPTSKTQSPPNNDRIQRLLQILRNRK
jgi:hypothetical protein